MSEIKERMELSDEQIAQVSGGNAIEDMIRDRMRQWMDTEEESMKIGGTTVSDKTVEEAMREYEESNPLAKAAADMLRHR